MPNNGNKDTRRLAVITGACGGMGRVCARLFGRDYQLALVDVGAENLERDAAALRSDGYSVPITMAVDIRKQDEVAALADWVEKTAPLGVLLHIAGLSPTLGSWQAIVGVNLVGTRYLLDAFLPLAVGGSVAVCIASVAGHLGRTEKGLDDVLDQPLDPGFPERLEPFLQRAQIPGDPLGLSSPAYSISKYAVIRL